MADFALGVEPGEHPFEGEEIGPDVGCIRDMEGKAQVSTH